MGTRREVLGRVVVVKTNRKSGNGGKGGGRKDNSGKRGVIYSVAEDGTRTELALLNGATFLDGATFTDLSRKLRRTGLIPQHVTLNKSGETKF